MADVIALVALVFFIICYATSHISQDQINAACVGKGGVISYSDHTWGVTSGAATVVCGDHKAYRVKGS